MFIDIHAHLNDDKLIDNINRYIQCNKNDLSQQRKCSAIKCCQANL